MRLETRLLDYIDEMAPAVTAEEAIARRESPNRSPVKTRTPRPRRGLAWALTAFVVILAVGGLYFAVIGGDGQVVNQTTVPTSTPILEPVEGTWVTTDADGSTPTMDVEVSGDGVVEIVVVDDVASVCSGAASTMTGTGRLEVETVLVIPSPVLTCDDGSQPEALSGPPLEEVLQDFTFTHDPGTGNLTDNFGLVWTREVADPSPEPTTPPPSEAEVTELLNGFLEARIAGEGAQQYLNSLYPAVRWEDIPLLYATSSGAPYERAEFEQVPGVEWPYGFKAFKVRLFAGDTVVEQLFFMPHDDPEYFPADGRLGLEYQPHGFATEIAPTTEDGQPLAMPVSLFDGEVTLHAAHPWIFHDGSFGRLIPDGPGVGPTTDGAERNEWDLFWVMADPAPAEVEASCQTGPAPDDAAALAESIRSYPFSEATAPVAVSAGGAEALMMDVKIRAGTIVCGPATGGGDLHNGVLDPVFDQDGPYLGTDSLVTGVATGDWMRLYLFDVPEGSSMRILAIAIVAPESGFKRAVEAAAPVVDSVEFHAP